MTEEKLIADGALKRARDIVDNKDFWTGPSAAKTSGEAVATLLGVAGVARQLEQIKSAESPDPAPKAEPRQPRQPRVKEESTKEEDAKPDPTEA